MKLRLRGLVGLGCAAVLAAAAVGSTASAVPEAKRGDSTCPRDRLCLWDDANYTGDRLLISTRRLSNKIYDVGVFNDSISSLKLRKPGAALLYANVDGGSPYRCFRFEDRKVPDLADAAWQFDDQASSSKIPKNPNNQACSAP